MTKSIQHNDLKINLKLLVVSSKACFGQGSVHNFVSRTTRDLIKDALLKNRLMKKKKEKLKENIPALSKIPRKGTHFTELLFH